MYRQYDPILALSKKKKPKRSQAEKAAIISEMEKPIKLNIKVTSYAFENWLEKQVQRAELRWLEAERKNMEDWVIMDIYRKKMQLRQTEINFLALIYSDNNN